MYNFDKIDFIAYRMRYINRYENWFTHISIAFSTWRASKDKDTLSLHCCDNEPSQIYFSL